MWFVQGVSGDCCHMIFPIGRRFTHFIEECVKQISGSKFSINLLFVQGLNQEEIGNQHFVLSIVKVLKPLALHKKEASTEGKKIKGRKRHIVTDTQGNLLHVKVHAANIHDSIAGVPVLQAAFDKYPSIQGASADAGYRGTTQAHVLALGKLFELSKKIVSGWAVLAKRWVVERTFAWLNGSRRLAKDYEISIQSQENFIRIAHMFTLLQRIT